MLPAADFKFTSTAGQQTMGNLCKHVCAIGGVGEKVGASNQRRINQKCCFASLRGHFFLPLCS